jgi:MoxR-like ATPase
MDGKDHFLKIPFFTIATQNPDIYAGTKPVDEALSDRFMICEPLEELDRESRKKVQRLEDEELVIKPILRNEEENDGEHELLTIQKLAKTIAVPEKIEDLILDVTEGAKPFDAKNPPHPDKQTAHPLIQEHFRIGAYGERANQTLRRLSRAKALMQGRTSVEPGDVKEMIVPLLFHRMVPLPKLRGMSDDRKVDVLKMYADECIPGHS